MSHALLLLSNIVRKGSAALYGTCLDAEGLAESSLIAGATPFSRTQVADWTQGADKVLVF